MPPRGQRSSECANPAPLPQQSGLHTMDRKNISSGGTRVKTFLVPCIYVLRVFHFRLRAWKIASKSKKTQKTHHEATNFCFSRVPLRRNYVLRRFPPPLGAAKSFYTSTPLLRMPLQWGHRLLPILLGGWNYRPSSCSPKGGIEDLQVF